MRYAQFDLHGYHPTEVVDGDLLRKLVQQSWELGNEVLILIHGHGHNRVSRGFVNTNTGYLGLKIRDDLRYNGELRQWIKISTLDCSEAGSTSVKLKPNPHPSRTQFDPDLLSSPMFFGR